MEKKWLVAVLVAALIPGFQAVLAQDTAKKEMAHTPEQLRPFEGVFQAGWNKYFFLHMTVKDNHLIVRQLWDNTETIFFPDTELSFFNLAFPRFTLDFIKDSSGNINRMLTFKRDAWHRAKPPQPLEPRAKALSATYISKDDPDNRIRLTVRDGQLIVTQLWDKKELRLEAIADDYFYNTPESYSLRVMENAKGVVTGVMLLGVDLFLKK